MTSPCFQNSCELITSPIALKLLTLISWTLTWRWHMLRNYFTANLNFFLTSMLFWIKGIPFYINRGTKLLVNYLYPHLENYSQSYKVSFKKKPLNIWLRSNLTPTPPSVTALGVFFFLGGGGAVFIDRVVEYGMKKIL